MPKAKAKAKAKDKEEEFHPCHAWRKLHLKDVKGPVLLEDQLPCRNPFTLFDIWFKKAAKEYKPEDEEVNAVSLCTARDNRPSCRMVLLKHYDKNGFTIFTNYNSRKGMEMHDNPNVALLLFWSKTYQEIRIEGVAKRIPAKQSDKYWATRPIGSRISSSASPQSKVIPSRKFLDEKMAELEEIAETEGEDAIKRPKHWGGILVQPTAIEFWQGHANRAHDRIKFVRDPEDAEPAEDGWFLQRLAP